MKTLRKSSYYILETPLVKIVESGEGWNYDIKHGVCDKLIIPQLREVYWSGNAQAWVYVL
jgi:hypothetical protein